MVAFLRATAGGPAEGAEVEEEAECPTRKAYLLSFATGSATLQSPGPFRSCGSFSRRAERFLQLAARPVSVTTPACRFRMPWWREPRTGPSARFNARNTTFLDRCSRCESITTARWHTE